MFTSLKKSLVVTALVGAAGLTSGLSHAAPVADSIADFSTVQGADGWSYGFFNKTALGGYSSSGFVPFAEFDLAQNRWQAPDAQLPAKNNFYLSIDALGGHPNGVGPDDQDANIWAVRRYISEVDGPIRLDIDLHKINTNPNAGGITGRVFVDGVEVFSRYIETTDDVGVLRSLFFNVAVGTPIDFAIDPTGVATGRDGIESARADGTHFSARININDVPLPATASLALLGLGLLAWPRRPHPRR